MEKITAVLKCTVGEWEVRMSLPHGKPKVLQFTDKNNFTVEVEKEITYIDAFGKLKVHHENWPQHLLNYYPFLELVETKKAEPIIAPPFVDKKDKVKKGKENEKSS